VNGVTIAVSALPKGVSGVEIGAMNPTLLGMDVWTYKLSSWKRTSEDKEREPGAACSGVQTAPVLVL
jgi:hypothetical protein